MLGLEEFLMILFLGFELCQDVVTIRAGPHI